MTTLAPGGIAIIDYNTDGTDSFEFVALQAIATGTQIFFTDMTWNGTAFVAGANDSTVTFTASSNIAAGTGISHLNAQFSGTLNLDSARETIYAHQGTLNSPTTFPYALDTSDNNTTFNGSLSNTGLVVGTDAVAVPFDNAMYAGPTGTAETFQFAPHTGLLADISNNAEWWGANNTGQTALNQPGQTGPFLSSPAAQIWFAAAGGGNAIVHVDNQTGTSTGTNQVQLFTADT